MPNKPFVLSPKVVIRDSSGRCLLLKRSLSSRNNKGKWDFPGGKVDAGETFEEALLREVEEETKLSICLDRVVGAAESDLPDRRVAYLFLEGHVTSGQVHLSEEHDECRWVDPSGLSDVDVCPQFEAFVMKYSQGNSI